MVPLIRAIGWPARTYANERMREMWSIAATEVIASAFVKLPATIIALGTFNGPCARFRLFSDSFIVARNGYRVSPFASCREKLSPAFLRERVRCEFDVRELKSAQRIEITPNRHFVGILPA